MKENENRITYSVGPETRERVFEVDEGMLLERGSQAVPFESVAEVNVQARGECYRCEVRTSNGERLVIPAQPVSRSEFTQFLLVLVRGIAERGSGARFSRGNWLRFGLGLLGLFLCTCAMVAYCVLLGHNFHAGVLGRLGFGYSVAASFLFMGYTAQRLVRFTRQAAPGRFAPSDLPYNLEGFLIP